MNWPFQPHYIRLPLWPRWLAQRLCSHAAKEPVGWSPSARIIRFKCPTCDKQFDEVNSCRHEKVAPVAWEDMRAVKWKCLNPQCQMPIYSLVHFPD